MRVLAGAPCVDAWAAPVCVEAVRPRARAVFCFWRVSLTTLTKPLDLYDTSRYLVRPALVRDYLRAAHALLNIIHISALHMLPVKTALYYTCHR